ncbi:hypothetical protein [Brevundimonas goettingensis]|jgi:hypothetical protein|uniref:Uncharacterized protein n=1 Tax=Brevundimonas goettingensis TaxID=2774190 RepID=A0A975C4X8_9CAUL|nr:hypothetical protein [Brevundimonas goettingensis]QTC91356.1 hypothetical protein IFJ75_19540 [Brevundimonas goettingensis]
MTGGREETRAPQGLQWAREVWVGVVGLVLGVALVAGLTEDMGRRVCGGAASIPGAAVLLGCDR